MSSSLLIVASGASEPRAAGGQKIAASQQIVVYGLAEATASEKLFTSKPGGVFRGQKDRDGGDVAGSANAAERSLREGGLREIRSDRKSVV